MSPPRGKIKIGISVCHLLPLPDWLSENRPVGEFIFLDCCLPSIRFNISNAMSSRSSFVERSNNLRQVNLFFFLFFISISIVKKVLAYPCESTGRQGKQRGQFALDIQKLGGYFRREGLARSKPDSHVMSCTQSKSRLHHRLCKHVLAPTHIRTLGSEAKSPILTAT